MSLSSRDITGPGFNQHDGRLNHAIGLFITFVFFLSFLVVGLSTYRTYGVHIDDYNNRVFGGMWGHYVKDALSSGTAPPMEAYIVGPMVDHNLCHGPFWELSLRSIEKLFVRRDAPPWKTIVTRHLASFLLFYVSAIFFFLTCRHIFRGLVFPLLGTLIYITHPRPFAHSYYNTVDIGFLSFFAISIYTCILFMEKPGLRTGLCHGIACALVVDTRIAGLIVPFTTMLIFAMESLLSINLAGNWRRLAGALSTYLGTFCGTMVLFWPFLWSNPIAHFLASLKGGVQLPLAPGLDAGKPFDIYYNFQWIGMTTPLGYLLLFFFGLVALALYLFKLMQLDRREGRALLTALMLIAVSLGATSAARTVLYDGWRHHYFLYPPLVIVCLFGLLALKRCVRGVPLLSADRLGTLLAVAVAGACALDAIMSIIETHPFQHSYVNQLAGNYKYTNSRCGNGVCTSSSRVLAAEDYWSLSRKQALDYILQVQPEGRLSVYCTRFPWANDYRATVPEPGYERVMLAENVSSADYIIDDYDIVREGILDEKYGTLLKLFESQHIAICAVYQVRSGQSEGPGQ